MKTYLKNTRQRSKMDLTSKSNLPFRIHPTYLSQTSLYSQVHVFLHWYPYDASAHGSEQLAPKAPKHSNERKQRIMTW